MMTITKRREADGPAAAKKQGAETKNFTGHLGLMSQIIAAFLWRQSRAQHAGLIS